MQQKGWRLSYVHEERPVDPALPLGVKEFRAEAGGLARAAAAPCHALTAPMLSGMSALMGFAWPSLALARAAYGGRALSFVDASELEHALPGRATRAAACGA